MIFEEEEEWEKQKEIRTDKSFTTVQPIVRLMVMKTAIKNKSKTILIKADEKLDLMVCNII